MEKEPTFKRSDYLNADEKNIYCAFLVANDPDFPFEDMKIAIGEGLRQRVQYANIVLGKEGQRKSEDICPAKGNCEACNTLKDYNKRLNQPTSLPNESPSNFVISIKSKEKG